MNRPRFVGEAAEVLRRLPEGPGAPPASARRVAAALGMPSPRLRAEAAMVLWGLGTSGADAGSRSGAEPVPSSGPAGAPDTCARRAVNHVLCDFGQGYAP